MNSATEIARMWISKGTIVSTIGRDRKVERKEANGKALTNKPLTVLVNRETATGTEILAAALQENSRAILVGSETFGSNTIQSIKPLTDGSGLAVTLSRWKTPLGRDVSQSRIIPHVVITLTDNQRTDIFFQNRDKIATPNDPQYVEAVKVLLQFVRNQKSDR